MLLEYPLILATRDCIFCDRDTIFKTIVYRLLAPGGGNVYTPLLENVFVKYIGKFYAYDFLAMLLKVYRLTLNNKFSFTPCREEVT